MRLPVHAIGRIRQERALRFKPPGTGQFLVKVKLQGRPNGNLTSATPPGKLAHDFAYTAVDLIASYTPPAISGTGATTYTYNLDRDLTTITRPDRETIKYGYDTAGRVTSIAVPTGTTTYTYNSTTGNLATAVNGVEQIT